MHNLRLLLSNPSTTYKNKLLQRDRRVTTLIPLSINRGILNHERKHRVYPYTIRPRNDGTNNNLYNNGNNVLPRRQLPRPNRRTLNKPLLRRRPTLIRRRHRHSQYSTPNLKKHFLKRKRNNTYNPNPTRHTRQTLLAREYTIKRTSRHTRLRRNLVMISNFYKQLILRSPYHRLPLRLQINSRPKIIMRPNGRPRGITIRNKGQRAGTSKYGNPHHMLPSTKRNRRNIMVDERLPTMLDTSSLHYLLRITRPTMVARPLPRFIRLFLLASNRHKSVQRNNGRTLMMKRHHQSPNLLRRSLTRPSVMKHKILPRKRSTTINMRPIRRNKDSVFRLCLSPY